MGYKTHLLYEGSVWSQKFVKSFKVFLYTDHKNNTFRSKVQPTRRVTKKLLKMCIELEPLGIERVYIAGEDNILGDAPSRAPADREVARNLAVPLAPIKETIHRMFWAPDELAGDTRERLKQLHIENPGVLSYVPDQLLADAELVNEARPEDELAEPERAFGPAQEELGALKEQSGHQAADINKAFNFSIGHQAADIDKAFNFSEKLLNMNCRGQFGTLRPECSKLGFQACMHAGRAVKPLLEAEIGTEGQEGVRAKSLSTPGGKNAANKAFDGTPVQCSLGQAGAEKRCFFSKWSRNRPMWSRSCFGGHGAYSPA